MLEDSLLKYFRASTTLVAALGGADKIQLGQAVSTDKMPWLSIEIAPGTRTRISQTKMEQRNMVRIIVNYAPNQQAKGRQCIELALRLLENYRGALYSEQDTYVTCGSISGLSGLASVGRYTFSANIRFTEAYGEPS